MDLYAMKPSQGSPSRDRLARERMAEIARIAVVEIGTMIG